MREKLEAMRCSKEKIARERKKTRFYNAFCSLFTLHTRLYNYKTRIMIRLKYALIKKRISNAASSGLSELMFCVDRPPDADIGGGDSDACCDDRWPTAVAAAKKRRFVPSVSRRGRQRRDFQVCPDPSVHVVRGREEPLARHPVRKPSSPVMATRKNQAQPRDERRPREEEEEEQQRPRDLATLRDKALEVVLPTALVDACDFARFVEGATAAMEFIDKTFVLATELADRDREDDILELSFSPETLADDMRCVSTAFTAYWMEHADEMLKEIDLSMDDACAERLPTATVAFNVVALADVSRRILHPSTHLSVSPEELVTSATTAESFESVRRQLLVQSVKPIVSYTPSDLTRAMDSLCRSWNRISVDASLLRYVAALRLRYGMLIRCASRKTDKEAQWFDDAIETTSGWYRVPRVAFMEEMTHRFRAFTEIEWMRSVHGPAWTPEDLCRRLEISAKRGAIVSTIRDVVERGHTEEEEEDIGPSVQRDQPAVMRESRVSRSLGCDRVSQSLGCDPITVAENKPFDRKFAATAVLKVLRDYAEIVKGGGTIYTTFRSCYLEYLICPGDDGVFRTRNPNMTPSTNNILIAFRGSKLYAEANHTTLDEPHEMLQSAIDTDAAQTNNRRSRIDTRASYTLAQEVMGLCTFDCLMKGRFNVGWRERYTITRATYRNAKARGHLTDVSLPMLVVVANKYVVLYRGRLLETSSIFESIAWWLEIMRAETGGVLPTTPPQQTKMMSEEEEESARETFELVRDADPMALELDYPEGRNSNGNVDTDDASSQATAAADSTLWTDHHHKEDDDMPDIMEELERKTKCVDASALCMMPRRGAASFPVKMDRKRTCIVSDTSLYTNSETKQQLSREKRRRRRRMDDMTELSLQSDGKRLLSSSSSSSEMSDIDGGYASQAQQRPLKKPRIVLQY